MMLPTSNPIDITSLQAVKDFAEVLTAKDDAIIASLITSFSQWALTYCSRETLSSIFSFTEVYDGNGSTRLFTRNSPIQTLVAVLVNGNAMPLSAGYGKAGAFIEQSKKSIGIRSGSIRSGSAGSFLTTWYPAGSGPAFAFWKGQGNIQIQYTAGYLPVSVLNDVLTVAAQTVQLSAGPWVADAGVVFYPSLVPLTLVPSAPTTGQYSVVAGLYTFAAADNGKQVAASYSVSQAPADLELCARRTVAVAYKRRQWLDQASKTLGAQGASGTTRYRDWKLTPEDEVTMQNYRRLALT